MKDKRVVFMGTPEFAVPVLNKLIENTNVVLVVTQPDAYVGRKHILTPSPISVIAKENNIEVFAPEKLKNEYEYVLNKKPDIIITCAYGQIVPKQILDYPEYGCINVHASLLPLYRGANPIARAIYDGERETGVTIMYMDETLDTGNMIHSESIPIDINDTLGTLSDKLSILGANLLIKTLPKIFDSTNFDIPQDNESATIAPKFTRKDEQIDFNKTRLQVYNQVRSLNPEPSAFIMLNGEEMKVLECVIGDEISGKPGIISSVSKTSFNVNCKDGIINITKIKPFGKKEMYVRDYFNGKDKNSLLNEYVGEVNE
jgi:methionyl-tRNA formyltransferase